jgi:hypothetical protein
MDCEKFESALMGELYGELDELTSAAAKRHVAGCARCAALLGGLRATRRVAVIPLVELPAGFEERLLGAVREAQKVVPMRGRVARAVSLAGSWAMRPQTAMAALFFITIGTSVLLLRGKSAREAATAEVTVTEQGAPASAPAPAATSTASPFDPSLDPKGAMAAPSTALAARSLEGKPAASGIDLGGPGGGEEQRGGRAKGGVAKDREDDSLAMNASAPAGAPQPAPAVAAPPSPQAALEKSADKKTELSPFDSALQSYRAGRFDDAARSFDGLAAGDPNADLWAARAVRESKGCRNAVARFDKVARRAGATSPGWDALLEGALCYRAIGDFGNARVRLSALLGVDSHKDRARAELDRMNELQQAQGTETPPAAAARPSPKRAAGASATASPKTFDRPAAAN